MLQNYFKIAWRKLLKGKLFSFINLTGLSVGMAVVILIMLFVKHEWSYDNFHANSDRIYRAWVKENYKGTLIFNSVTPLLVGSELENNFPEVKKTARFMNANNLVRRGDFMEQELLHFVDPDFLGIFDFQLIEGETGNVLENLHQIVITEAVGEKYFGDPTPIGETLTMNVGGDWTDFSVSGIIEAPPSNSSLQFQILIPFGFIEQTYREGTRQCWTCVFGETYVMLDETANVDILSAKIAPFIDEKVKDSYQPGEYIIGLQPLEDIHLNNDIPVGIAAVSDARYPYILASVALLILLLACINFTSLSIGQSVTRAREVGVRKVTGATQWQLRSQFWSEAILTAGIALVLGVTLAQVSLPLFSSLADIPLSLDITFQNILFFLALALVIGLLSGLYPAMILSRFAPVQAIQGILSNRGKNKHLVLRSLVGFQFVLSVFLIICTMGMQKQMTYLQNKNLGFKKDQTVIVPFSGSGGPFSEMWNDAHQLQERLKNELAGSGVKKVLTSSHTFGTQGWAQVGYTEQETDKFRRFNAQQIDYEYIDAMGIELVEGRKFDKDISSDKKAVIVNEAFVKAYQLDAPIGALLPGPFREYQVIGVAKDFHFSSLHTPIAPLAMMTDFFPFLRVTPDMNFNDNLNPKFSLKVESNNLAGTLNEIKETWQALAPEEAFSFTFMDENLNQQYLAESKLSNIISLATLLAILVACLGLFGIATLTIAQRTKEIGVRKVLGASTSNIVLMINKNFAALALIATLIAAPISWYFINEWLADFAYRIDIQWWVFALSGILAIAVAFLTVSFQSVRAAMANPVNSLRSE